MKQEEFMENIYGCLERIENRIDGLSMPQSTDGDVGVGKEVIQELNALKADFKRVLEVFVMVKGDTADLQKRNSIPDRPMGTPSVPKSEQQAYHKNQNEFLKRSARTEKDTILYIPEKMKPLSTPIRSRMKGPDVICHRHSISIDTPYIFWTLIILVTYPIAVSVAFCFGEQLDYDCSDSDLRYRYIKMRGEASPGQIGELENLFGLDRDEARIEQMREDAETYEGAVRRQATLVGQARLKEQAAKGQESKTKFIKVKQGQPKSNLKSRS